MAVRVGRDCSLRFAGEGGEDLQTALLEDQSDQRSTLKRELFFRWKVSPDGTAVCVRGLTLHRSTIDRKYGVFHR